MSLSSPDPVPVTERFHDLDAVRALALLLGVALHATMSFLEPRIWIVSDVSHSTGLGVLFYVVHMFRMTTFFLLAGFFARMMLQKRGVVGFVANRLKRVALPLVIFWPIVFASIVTVLIMANMPAPGSAAAAAPPPPPPALTAANFPLTHLWFLYVLMLFYASALVLKIITDVLHVGGFLGKALDAITAVFVRYNLIGAVLIVPVAMAFYPNTRWMMWFGIMSPDTGLLPNPGALAGFFTAFGLGWFLHRRSDLLDYFADRFWLYLLSAVPATIACLKIAGIHPAIVPVSGHDHPVYILLYTLATWSWTLGLIGAARRFLRRENKVIRYLSDASYWIYILHIPVVMGLQYALKDIPGPAEAKYSGILFGTVMFGLFTYQIMIRYTFIGTILNGRHRKSKAMPQSQEAIA